MTTQALKARNQELMAALQERGRELRAAIGESKRDKEELLRASNKIVRLSVRCIRLRRQRECLRTKLARVKGETS